MRYRNIIIFALPLAWILACPTFGAGDQEVPKDVKSEFRQNISKRNRLVRELARVDQKAADATLIGANPVEMHAEQIEIQDRVDLLQLRLETMAVRWNLSLPEPPSIESEDVGAESELVARRIGAAFDDGRARANVVLRARCLRMLASIDYASFLADDR